MTPVILYGTTSQKIVGEINRILSPYGILSVSCSKIAYDKNDSKFIVFECNNCVEIATPDGIIVMIGKTTDLNINIKGNYKGVVFSSDKNALQFLKKNDITAITCGMASEDTLILSSITDSSAFICLQRRIETLSGNIIEPAEYKVTLTKNITDYALLATAAILLLCDIEPDGLKY